MFKKLFTITVLLATAATTSDISKLQGDPKKVSHYHESLLNRIKTRH